MLGEQIFIALPIQFGDAEIGNIARLFRSRLGQRGRQGAIIDLRQQLSAFHMLAFVHQYPGQDTVDLRPHRHNDERLHGADSGLRV